LASVIVAPPWPIGTTLSEYWSRSGQKVHLCSIDSEREGAPKNGVQRKLNGFKM